MKTKSICVTGGYSLGLLVLLSIGVLLFALRHNKFSQTLAHEMSVKIQATSEIIIKNQFLIYVPKIPKDFQAILDSLDLEVNMPLLNWILVNKKGHKSSTIIRLDSPEAQQDRLILSSLLEHPHILDAQHNFVLEKALVPINNYFTEEWQLDISAIENPAGLNMPPAWEITKGSEKNVVAIIDDFLVHGNFTFFERFPDCKERISYFNPYVFSNTHEETGSIPHGEIMLLALGACTNEKAYSTGIDWHARLIATQRASPGQAQSFLAALAVSGIDVCKESTHACLEQAPQFAHPPKPSVILLPFANNSPDLLQFSADMIRAIRERNILVVASAGNNNQDASSFFPGATPGVINIGALNKHGERASFSNWGPSIDVLAPGDSLSFSFPSGKKEAQGTSISAAYAAGALSLITAINPQITEGQARFLLRDSARPLECSAYCDQALCSELCCKDQAYKCGNKALDIYEALKKAQTKLFLAPILALSNNYVVIQRNYVDPQEIITSNEGDIQAHVEALVFDDNLEVKPTNFVLDSRQSVKSSQVVQIFFKREPFARTIHKIRFVAKSQGNVIDWSDLYIEYVPKK